MMNLTNMSESLAAKSGELKNIRSIGAKSIALILVSFPAIFGLLFLGDYTSAQKKKTLLVSAAERLINEKKEYIAPMANYEFSLDYAYATQEKIRLLRKVDDNFPQMNVIHPDKIDSTDVFLAFRDGDLLNPAKKNPEDEARGLYSIDRTNFIFSASAEDREFLRQVFFGNNREYKFRAEKGNYYLYYPVEIEGKVIVIFFTDYQRYGKG